MPPLAVWSNLHPPCGLGQVGLAEGVCRGRAALMCRPQAVEGKQVTTRLFRPPQTIWLGRQPEEAVVLLIGSALSTQVFWAPE